MTKATPAGRTLADPPAVPGGNPKHWESGQVFRPAAWKRNSPGRASVSGLFFYSPPMHKRLLLAAALVLLVGLGAAAGIYFTAEDEQDLSTSYVVVIDPTMTKTYVRELQRFGGKAAVLFDELNRWFAARWHGKALGITVAWIAIAVAALLFWISGRSASHK